LYFENEIFYLFVLNSVLLLQGLILSNALRTHKNIEDEGYTMALNNLRSEVIELRNEGLEKDKILISLVNRVKEDEASFKAQAKIQKNEIEDLRKQLAKAKEKCTSSAHTLKTNSLHTHDLQITKTNIYRNYELIQT
jgi:hypothetical protein